MKKLFLLLIPLLMFAGCGSSNKSSDDLVFETGKYTANVMDPEDVKISTGTFEITKIQGSDVEGNFSFVETFFKSGFGSEAMEGPFSGQLGTDNKTLWIKTNPRLADYNVFMNITAGRFSYLGEWRFSTMMGTEESGKIQLFKLN